MIKIEQTQLVKTLWDIAGSLRGAIFADNLRFYILSFLFLKFFLKYFE